MQNDMGGMGDREFFWGVREIEFFLGGTGDICCITYYFNNFQRYAEFENVSKKISLKNFSLQQIIEARKLHE